MRKLSNRDGSGSGLKMGFDGSSSGKGSSPAALRAMFSALSLQTKTGAVVKYAKRN